MVALICPTVPWNFLERRFITNLPNGIATGLPTRTPFYWNGTRNPLSFFLKAPTTNFSSLSLFAYLSLSPLFAWHQQVSTRKQVVAATAIATQTVAKPSLPLCRQQIPHFILTTQWWWGGNKSLSLISIARRKSYNSSTFVWLWSLKKKSTLYLTEHQSITRGAHSWRCMVQSLNGEKGHLCMSIYYVHKRRNLEAAGVWSFFPISPVCCRVSIVCLLFSTLQLCVSILGLALRHWWNHKDHLHPHHDFSI